MNAVPRVHPGILVGSGKKIGHSFLVATLLVFVWILLTGIHP